MIRLTWRLARPNIVSSAVLLAVVVVYAVWTNRVMHGDMRTSGLAACLGSGGDCEMLSESFMDRYEILLTSFEWINLVPVLIGVFWGGPLIARELEQGTHRLVWTQSHGRGRWLAARLGVFLVGAVAVAAVITEVTTWWFKPVERVQVDGITVFGRLDPDVFDYRGLVPLAYTVFAFAVGAAAGAVFKRVVPAMVATLVLYLPVKVAVQVLREHYRTPLTTTYPLHGDNPRAGKGDWQVTHEVVDRTGAAVTHVSVPDACRVFADQAQMKACVAQQTGYQVIDTYHPVGRFWTFQLIESGIYAGLAAAVFGVAVWWVLRRLA
jgi:hypothetical protein